MTQQTPLLLAIDCSDRACSLALGNEQTLVEEFTDEPRQHAKRLLSMYRKLFERSSYQQEDITAIAIASGPGSFTGLRIGFSFAQGLSFALSAPLIEVSSLEALALSNIKLIEDKDIEQVHVCLDARMGELYVAGFNVNSGIADTRASLLQRQYEDALIGVSDFNLTTDYANAALMGSGFALDGLALLDSALIASDVCIHASAVHRLGMNLLFEGKMTDAIGAEPVYLRRENAWKTVRQQRQAASDKALNKKSQEQSS